MTSSVHQIREEHRSDLDPLCPHCSKELETVYIKPMESMLGKRYVYFCPYCRKVLGVSHRKGFWMG